MSEELADIGASAKAITLAPLGGRNFIGRHDCRIKNPVGRQHPLREGIVVARHRQSAKPASSSVGVHAAAPYRRQAVARNPFHRPVPTSRLASRRVRTVLCRNVACRLVGLPATDQQYGANVSDTHGMAPPITATRRRMSPPA